MDSNSFPNMHGVKKRKISEIVDLEQVIKDFRRRSEDASLDTQIPWHKLNDMKFVGNVTQINGEAYFVTGSKYGGTWDATGMAGVGRYTMPHGAIFEGEVRDGVFHGHGTLEWPQKQRIDGVWLHGKLQEKRYTFSDELVFQEKDWDYCQFPDRRFFQCTKKGLNPAGNTLKSAKQPTPVINPSCYDTGEGVFNKDTLSVTSYQLPHKVIRIPTKEETEWIIKNCRRGLRTPVGYQPWLNENWSTDSPDLPYCLPFSNDSPQSWWKRLTTFERDVEVKADNAEPVLGKEDISNKSCCCYEFGSAEESSCGLASAISKVDHCTCIEDKKCEADIEKEEYTAFREIICDKLSKYKNLDLSKTICVAPHNGEYSAVDFTHYNSQTSWEDEFSKDKFPDDLSNSLEKQMREIEKLRLLHGSVIKGSSLDENKLDVENDEGMKKEKIKEIEEAKEELGEIMTKSKEEEILQDSSKQKMDQKDKEANSTEKEKEKEIQEDLQKRKKEIEEKEDKKEEQEKKEKEEKKEEEKEIEKHTLEETDSLEKQKLEDETKKKIKEVDEDTLKISDLAEKEKLDDTEGELEVEDSESTEKSKDLDAVEKGAEVKLKINSSEQQTVKNSSLTEDDNNTDHSEESEDLDKTKKAAKEKLKTSDSAKEQKLKDSHQKKNKSKVEAKTGDTSKAGKSIRKISEVDREKDLFADKKHSVISVTSDEINGEAELFSLELLKTLPKTDQKLQQTRSSPQLQQKKKYTSDQTGDLGFSGTFAAPRAKLEFVRKPCDPNICLKDALEECVHHSEKYHTHLCKPKKAIEMVHLRVKSKFCHE